MSRHCPVMDSGSGREGYVRHPEFSGHITQANVKAGLY